MNDYPQNSEYNNSASTGAESAKTALIFLSIGIGVGALLSLLLAPRSGPEIREAVRSKLDDTRRGWNRQTSRLRQQASRLGGPAAKR